MTSAEVLNAKRAQVDTLLQGERGAVVCAALTEVIDEVVRSLYLGAETPTLTILATGGYGRRELCPESDIDLFFLAEDPEANEAGVQHILHGLWDLDLQVGYSVGSVDHAVTLGIEDLNTATTLVTARVVVGPTDPAHRLGEQLRQGLSGPRGEAFHQALQDGISARHQRYGGSIYLLEPNLKHGPGGLRDLNTVLWASAVAFDVSGWHQLVPRGVCSPQTDKQLARARDHLLRVRYTMQSGARYSGDRLSFEHQERLAQRLGFGEDKPAIERFMTVHYGHARVVEKWSRILLERCQEHGRPRRGSVTESVDPHFELVDGALMLREPDGFIQNPVQLMRAFSVARQVGAPIHGSTQEQAIEALGQIDEGWRRNPEVVRGFLDVLAEPEDPWDALGAMHEVGVLGAMLPEFGAITHRTLHDLYHVYTVDIHSLHAIRKLKALHRGDLAAEEPLLTQAMGLVQDTVVLYLSLLMHDAGKALGGGHAIKGARLIPPIGRRLGLSGSRTRRAAWLVRDHLLMAHLSQRRDLFDETMIRQFARIVGDEESLAMLFILTWADALTTGPQAYTDWKAALLAELYARARDRLRRGLDLYADPQRLLVRRRRAMTRVLHRRADPRVIDVGGAVDLFLDSLPTAYFQKTRARVCAKHLEMLSRLHRDIPLVLEAVARPRRGYTLVHVVAHKAPGLLAAVVGVLLLHDMDIVTAELHVTSAGKAIYTFRVRWAAGGAPSDDENNWTRVRAELQAVLTGKTDIDTRVAALCDRSGRFEWPAGPAVETRVQIDEGISETCTVFDVHTADQAGLLFALIRGIESAEVDIVLARITTEADGAHDTFYVRHPDGGRLAADEAQSVLDVIGAAIEALG